MEVGSEATSMVKIYCSSWGRVEKTISCFFKKAIDFFSENGQEKNRNMLPKKTEAVYHYYYQNLEAFKFKAESPRWVRSLNNQVVNR